MTSWGICQGLPYPGLGERALKKAVKSGVTLWSAQASSERRKKVPPVLVLGLCLETKFAVLESYTVVKCCITDDLELKNAVG